MVAANARWYYSPAYWGLMVNIYNSLYWALTYKISQNLSSPRFFFIPRTTGKHRFLMELNVLSAFTAIFRECTIYWRFAAIYREALFTGNVFWRETILDQTRQNGYQTIPFSVYIHNLMFVFIFDQVF